MTAVILTFGFYLNSMPHIITDKCINCGACESTCPNGAISEGPERYVIDPQKCDDCGSCVDICAPQAIEKE